MGYRYIGTFDLVGDSTLDRSFVDRIAALEVDGRNVEVDEFRQTIGEDAFSELAARLGLSSVNHLHELSDRAIAWCFLYPDGFAACQAISMEVLFFQEIPLHETSLD